MSLVKGSRLGKYVLIRRLGRGAFAEVWRASDEVEDRVVALKIANAAAVTEFGRKTLEQEARIAATLHHPHIVRLYNAGWEKDRFYLAFELAGKNLIDARGVRRSAARALKVVRQIAEALAYAHKKRIIHRDIKPENILIFSDERVAVADFGASCLSRNPGQTYSEIGTLGYVAPEQAYGKPCFASDVFSLGMIWYWLVTGHFLRWPFEWPEADAERIEKRLGPYLAPILGKTLRFRPEERYTTASELSRALERAVRRLERERAEPHPRRRQRRRRLRSVVSPREQETRLFERLYGRSLGLSYSCHRCDGPISEEMMHCPWCGTDDLSFLGVTPYPLVCPWCEKGVMAEWSACPWCYQGRFEPTDRRLKPDPRAERNCTRPGCSGKLRRFMRYCPVCKTKVRRRWTHPELPHTCDQCRWPTHREFWRYCPWCGRREPKAGEFA